MSDLAIRLGASLFFGTAAILAGLHVCGVFLMFNLFKPREAAHHMCGRRKAAP
jgi:hypothetical protein